ncbi:MAG: hypothetical protein Q3M30_08420 [Candidatus Electrothrix sp. Rat3]|nr:hypothetical protein [Candidatus Electrothrix rattekaaiensis]
MAAVAQEPVAEPDQSLLIVQKSSSNATEKPDRTTDFAAPFPSTSWWS